MTRRKPKPSYTPGFFTELMRRHNWPPGFVSRTADAVLARGSNDERNRRMRETEARALAGVGWAGGTIQMPGTTDNVRPAWMPRVRDGARNK